jgi:WhiB family redox-sensing transcriptional regulator
MDWSASECSTHPKEVFYPIIIDEHGVEWMDDGTIWEAYGDTSSFYDEARDLCRSCPLRSECLEHALAAKERFGMWGGLTPIERRRIERTARRQRLKVKRAAQMVEVTE